MSVLEISGIILTRVNIFLFVRVAAAFYQQRTVAWQHVSCLSLCCKQVKLVEQGMGYLVFGGLMTATLALLPLAFHLAQHLDMSSLGSLSLAELAQKVVGQHGVKAYAFFFITTVQRVCLTGLFFFMMCVAERTYKQVSGPFVWSEEIYCALLPALSILCGFCNKASGFWRLVTADWTFFKLLYLIQIVSNTIFLYTHASL